MRALNRLGSAAAAVALTAATAAAFAGPASAATAHDSFPGAGHAVFVQTDNTTGNRVVAYHRSGDGKLAWAHSYSTDGLGGVLTGSVVDHLASQGSLRYDPEHGLLYAVNAGSNTLSVFSVSGDKLSLRQVINSGGSFPVSVATYGERRIRPGIPGLPRPAVPDSGIEPAAGPGPDGDPAIHQHARAGRVLARRVAADRDDQGERQRHRRLRRACRRAPVPQPGGELRAGHGPVRNLL